MSPSIAVFADSEVGLFCARWLVSTHKKDISVVVTTCQNDIYHLAKESGVKTHVFQDDNSYLEYIDNEGVCADLGLLLWWPKIIRPSLINSAKGGFVNTHPSLLPHNRGKHYNFWALVEQCPFGVSLHLVEEGIDCGNIVAQKEISYTWEDTGETLYHKAIAGTKQLFVETYPDLRKLIFDSKAQDLSKGSIHFSSELEAASRISLDEPTTPRQLLNLLRARTFEGHPACSFCDDDVEYEVRIAITKKK
jgi:methionyl-tRNA formyltransferase